MFFPLFYASLSFYIFCNSLISHAWCLISLSHFSSNLLCIINLLLVSRAFCICNEYAFDDYATLYYFLFQSFLGEVELENLPLRKDALRNLGLPLQALKGTVGRIKLQIPVRQFRTAPWCILIENVYVVIGPVNLDEVIFVGVVVAVVISSSFFFWFFNS